jgi:hypothetical protein
MASIHRRIWEASNGPIPKGMSIDHVDGNTNNNNLSNLRLADSFGQNQNRGNFRNNTSGYKGVRQEGIKFRAKVRANGVLHDLGLFPTAEEASQAYQNAAKDLHGEFYREIN